MRDTKTVVFSGTTSYGASFMIPVPVSKALDEMKKLFNRKVEATAYYVSREGDKVEIGKVTKADGKWNYYLDME